jgi:general secretion pathway protein D
MKSFDGGRMLAKQVVAILFALSIGACRTPGAAIPDQVLDESSRASEGATRYSGNLGPRQAVNLTTEAAATGANTPFIVRGSDPIPVEADTPTTGTKNGEYVLNFDNAEIRDVLKTVLADMLGVGYTIDPAVQGSISLRTVKPIPRNSVLPALEEALKLAGIAIVSGTSGYQVVPVSGAAQRGAIGTAASRLEAGYQVRLVPLRYITAADVQRVLEPLVGQGTIIPVHSPNVNLVTLAGTASEVDRAERAVATFDVDWLRSQSFGLFPLRYSSAAEVTEDLNNVIGKQGPLAGIVRIAPITHLNAILVVSKNFTHVNQMRTWIERFDRGREVLKPKLFVYAVQNGRARDLAAVLTRVFSRKGTGSSWASSIDDASSASGALTAPSSPGLSAATSGSASSLATPPAFASGNAAGGSTTPDSPIAPGGSQTAGSPAGDLSITADEANNALLIMTTPEHYAQVEAALARLDVAPMQVLLEASIAEVDVNDNFKYGVQASFEKSGFAALSSALAASALGASTGGISAALIRSDIKATLDLLSNFTTVRVISAPKLMVLNNRTAALQVGDQVPVATSSAVSTITPNAPTVNTIQMYDTGIILRVTPRVNRNGRVQMDISQEVSASVPTKTSTLNSPTIQQRRVSTSVVVQDGQTIAIGGLMRDGRTLDRTGLPWFKDLPGAGALFGTSTDRVDRTELLVLITARVIRSGAAADAATEELHAKLPMLQGFRAPRPH